MARPSQPKKSLQRSAKRKDDISSLKTEVLKLRLQALNLPITGSRADLIAALQNATSSGSRTRSSAPQASSKATGRVSKRSKGSKAATSRTKSKQTVTAAKHREQNPESSSDTESEASSRHHESDEDDLSDAGLSADDLLKSSGRAGGLNTSSNALTAEHLQSVIQETVESTVHAALAQQNQLYGRSSVAARTANPLSPYRAPGAATPLGLNRPLDRNLEDRILRGPLDARADPTACSRTSAAGVVPAATRSMRAPNGPTTVVPEIQPTATDPRSSMPVPSSPIDATRLQYELLHHPNRNFVNSLINTLKFGARIGYSGPQKACVSRNLISASQHPEVVSSNLSKEIQKGRVAGPFLSSPLKDLQCHPVGVVPKKHSSEWRTIYHLSYPEGDSINDHIPKEPYSLQYVRVDDAIRILQTLGPGSFMAKTDLKSAFRLIPIHPDDWNLLGIYWQSRYYVDLFLPFGLRSAPFIFNQLSDALEWILKHNYGLKYVLHILDDFFLAEHTKLDCLLSFSTLLRFFMVVKAPVVASKTLGPSQVLEFMGIILDSVRMEARLPDDKLTRIRDLLESFTNRRSARLVELQSLIGTLQFACKVVVPGRTFLQRIINLTRGVPSRFHHVRLNKEFFKDIAMWKSFLSSWNGRSFFLDSALTPTPDLELYTDAASTVGFGGFFRGKWFQGKWPPHLRINKDLGISIEWQELFPIVVACAIWYPHFSGKRLQFWCDNETVVSIINSGHSKAPRIMDLVRLLVLLSMKYNFFVRAQHVPGVSNAIADALSRFQVQRFRELAPHADPHPCTIPPSLLTL